MFQGSPIQSEWFWNDLRFILSKVVDFLCKNTVICVKIVVNMNKTTMGWLGWYNIFLIWFWSPALPTLTIQQVNWDYPWAHPKIQDGHRSPMCTNMTLLYQPLYRSIVQIYMFPVFLYSMEIVMGSLDDIFMFIGLGLWIMVLQNAIILIGIWQNKVLHKKLK